MVLRWSAQKAQRLVHGLSHRGQPFASLLLRRRAAPTTWAGSTSRQKSVKRQLRDLRRSIPECHIKRSDAGGGYYYPTDDVARLPDEVRRFNDLGYRRAKIKMGSASLAQDLKRIDAATRLLDGPEHLAVDAIYAYTPASSIETADALAPLGLWWFEDICDPLDFETLAAVARRYAAPIAAGEALFSAAEANLLDRHGGLRRDRDILLFDPVHCYGLPGYLQIVEVLEKRGWLRAAFGPHGGHLFCLHVVAALRLGGAEVNPLCFQPFGGYGDNTIISEGVATPPQIPGIGFEARQSLRDLLATLDGDGRRRIVGGKRNKRGTPQGGVAAPIPAAGGVRDVARSAFCLRSRRWKPRSSADLVLAAALDTRVLQISCNIAFLVGLLSSRAIADRRIFPRRQRAHARRARSKRSIDS